MANNKNNDNVTEIVIKPVDKETIKSQIYEIRGFRVMLDSDIALYFGIETKALNRAMKRNIKRFPSTFCFQITKVELENLKFQSGISSQFDSYGGRRTLPFVYTEQGVAMLTSTLHTDRAIAASIQIMEAFVEMTHYLKQSNQMLPYRELYLLSNRQDTIEKDVRNIKKNMVTKDEISLFMKLFENSTDTEEILILDGEPFKADMAYQNIYNKATKNIIIIDDYLGIKTLHHLVTAKRNIDITIISDNKSRNPLRKAEYDDFLTEYPDRNISFIKSKDKIHDRYIILDYDISSIKIYHCGTSSKDAGSRITTITEIKDVNEYKNVIKALLSNPTLVL